MNKSIFTVDFFYTFFLRFFFNTQKIEFTGVNFFKSVILGQSLEKRVDYINNKILN